MVSSSVQDLLMFFILSVLKVSTIVDSQFIPLPQMSAIKVIFLPYFWVVANSFFKGFIGVEGEVFPVFSCIKYVDSFVARINYTCKEST